jgi:NADH-quinone oxidoreductase subunit L
MHQEAVTSEHDSSGHGGDAHGGHAHASDENSELRRAKGECSRDDSLQLASAGDVNLSLFALRSSELAVGVSDTEDDHAEHADHGSPAKSAIAHTLPNLPKWMFWLPIAIAYITPFYMMRCWWLTFMGKPRDQHVYDHAHETPWMYVPLIVLAVGTVYCSFWLFRPMIADAGGVAADAAAVVAIDGEAHSLSEVPRQAMLTLTHSSDFWTDPHKALIALVGFSWLIGMGLAALLYRNGPQLAGRIKERVPGLGFVHRTLENRLYIDHVYDFVLVGGIRLMGRMWGWFDTNVIDGIVDLSAALARGLGVFAGRQLDMPVEKRDIGLVDTLANGFARLVYDTGSELRRPQNGRIRTYVLLTAGAAAIALMCVLYSNEIGSGFNAIVSRVGALAANE